MISSLQKHLVVFLLLLNVTSFAFASEWNAIGSEKPKAVEIKLISSDIESSVLEMDLSGFNKTQVRPTGEFIISSPGTSSFLEAGTPDIGKIACSVIIPETGEMNVELISSSFQD